MLSGVGTHCTALCEALTPLWSAQRWLARRHSPSAPPRWKRARLRERIDSRAATVGRIDGRIRSQGEKSRRRIFVRRQPPRTQTCGRVATTRSARPQPPILKPKRAQLFPRSEVRSRLGEAQSGGGHSTLKWGTSLAPTIRSASSFKFRSRRRRCVPNRQLIIKM
jgi:hypothetical protein